MAIENRFRLGTYVLIVSTYILILLGSYVKAIHAGLACPDWPQCNGKWIPVFEDHRIFAEWFHRLWAMLNGFLLLGLTGIAFKDRKEFPTNFNLCLVLVILYAVQVLFGALTVWQDLAAAVVVAHLGNAVLIIILQITLAFLTTLEYYKTPQTAETFVAAGK